MKGYSRVFGFALLLVFSAQGCGRFKASAALASTSWSLQSYGNSSAPTPVLPGTKITASFAKDGKVSDTAGCNRYSGEFVVSAKRVSMTRLASTQMYCLEPDGIMDQESAFLGAMEQATSFEVKGRELRIHMSDGKGALTFLAGPQ